MVPNSNEGDTNMNILLSPISEASTGSDIATIAAELVHRVLGVRNLDTAAYRGDLGNVSGNVSRHHHHRHRHRQGTKLQTIDWDRFLDIFESVNGKSRVALAEHLFPEYQSYLLHLVCLCGAPENVVQALLDASLLPVTQKCGMNMEATPLHLACFAGCSESTVQMLLQADTKSATVLMKDIEERIPLHIACEKGATAESACIVKLLLDRDVKKQCLNVVDCRGTTPLQVAAQMASESIIAHLLEASREADEMKDNPFYLVDMPKQLPLHGAFHRRTASPGNVVRLLSTGPLQANLTTKDRRGQLPIHVACQRGACVGVEAFKELINNDKLGETFCATDAIHQTPADMLIRRINDGDELAVTTLEELAEADESRRFFGAEDSQGRTMLDAMLKSIQGLKEGTLTEVQIDALLLMLSCTPPRSGKYSHSWKTSRKQLGVGSYGRIFTDRRFHKTLNISMSRRSFTTYFMLDLYVRILLVVMFTYATTRAIEGNVEDHWAFMLVYLTSGYLLIWQMMLMKTHQLYYFREAWNILELLTLILVFISVSMLHSGIESTGSFRVLNTVVGGLVWFIIVTGSLRSTFLPFSIFVSGFTLILFYMIPFGITTFLMLGAFADMYFKSTFDTSACSIGSDTEAFCEYGSAFLKVYAMFIGGTDGNLLATDTDTNLLVLSILYSFLVVIVTLNVLVAVIFDAWGEVAPYGRLYYWEFRHQFLVETSFAVRWFGGVKSSFINDIDQHLDGVIYRFSGRPEKVNDLVNRSAKAREVALYIAEGIYMAVWFVLGLLSVSILWPRAFRKAIFAMAEEESAKPEKTCAQSGPDNARQRADKYKLRTKMSDTNFELGETRQQLAVSQHEIREMKQAIDDLKQLMVNMSATLQHHHAQKDGTVG